MGTATSKERRGFPGKDAITICFSRKIGVGALKIAGILAMLHLGFKGIRLGTTLPAFLSQTMVNVLVENYYIKLIGTVVEDIEAMMAGEYHNKQ